MPIMDLQISIRILFMLMATDIIFGTGKEGNLGANWYGVVRSGLSYDLVYIGVSELQ